MMKTIDVNKLSGSVSLPPSKSISHRAIIAAALSPNVSKIKKPLISEDTIATLEAVKKIGAKVEFIDDYLKVEGVSEIVFNENDKVINCKESGSTLRFLLPVFLLSNSKFILTGENDLVKRPLKTYFEMLDKEGIKYKKLSDNNLPLEILGSLESRVFNIEGDISSQYLTGMLFALAKTGDNAIINITTNLTSKGYIDLTIDMLDVFGIKVINRNYKQFEIVKNQKFKSRNLEVEGDISALAFFAQAGAIHGSITCANFNKNSLQGDIKILEFLTQMNVKYEIYNNTITFFKSEIIGTNIDLEGTPDLAPALIALASVAKGKTVFTNTRRLKFKESDRAKAMETELNLLGGNVEVFDNEIVVYGSGNKPLKGGCKINGHNDHRIVMALAVAGTFCNEPIFITDEYAVAKSYKNFWNDFDKLTKKQ